jgi:hypothetical protein
VHHDACVANNHIDSVGRIDSLSGLAYLAKIGEIEYFVPDVQTWVSVTKIVCQEPEPHVRPSAEDEELRLVASDRPGQMLAERRQAAAGYEERLALYLVVKSSCDIVGRDEARRLPVRGMHLVA